MRALLYSLAALLAGAMWGAASIAPAAQPAPLTSNDPREAFAIDLLAALGNAEPSADTIAFIIQWTCAEDSGSGAIERNNPLNTTQQGYNETVTINGDGVKGYATYGDGLDATVRTITNGYYDGVVLALQANDPAAALQALIASPWAGSHYSGGAAWPHGGC